MHAIAFLRSEELPATGPVVVLTGDERHLKRTAIERLARDLLPDKSLGLTRFPGEEADLASVCDELLTVSMWGNRRIVVVEQADSFVSRFREGLERYLQKPARRSVLVLDVKTWPKNTRLAKAVAKIGLDLDCSQLARAELVRWISETSSTAHGKTIGREAATLVQELAGDDLGLLEQEIAKLAAYVGDRSTIEADDVRTLVGGWRIETTWAMAAAVRRNRPGEAIDLLDRLLAAGESPYKILGGLTFVFRRLSHAVEQVREGSSLDAAVRDAGVFPREIDESSRYLRRIGRVASLRIGSRLLWADSDLKGARVVSERQVLETLLVSLSEPSALPARR